MSLTKTGALDYEETPFKINKKKPVKSFEQMSTGVILWKLAVRHKLFLLSLGNVILVLNWAFPEWAELVKSLI